jgi:hypothetical protein
MQSCLPSSRWLNGWPHSFPQGCPLVTSWRVLSLRTTRVSHGYARQCCTWTLLTREVVLKTSEKEEGREQSTVRSPPLPLPLRGCFHFDHRTALRELALTAQPSLCRHSYQVDYFPLFEVENLSIWHLCVHKYVQYICLVCRRALCVLTISRFKWRTGV